MAIMTRPRPVEVTADAERLQLGDQIVPQVAGRCGVGQACLFADQVPKQIEPLRPVPVQGRACIPAALSDPSERDPLPPLVEENLASGGQHRVTCASHTRIDGRVLRHLTESSRQIFFTTGCPLQHNLS